MFLANVSNLFIFTQETIVDTFRISCKEGSLRDIDFVVTIDVLTRTLGFDFSFTIRDKDLTIGVQWYLSGTLFSYYFCLVNVNLDYSRGTRNWFKDFSNATVSEVFCGRCE